MYYLVENNRSTLGVFISRDDLPDICDIWQPCAHVGGISGTEVAARSITKPEGKSSAIGLAVDIWSRTSNDIDTSLFRIVEKFLKILCTCLEIKVTYIMSIKPVNARVKWFLAPFEDSCIAQSK